jgi:DNA-binding protein HU-beta
LNSTKLIKALKLNLKKEAEMTKAELIEKMAKDAKVSKVAAGAVLDSFMANVTKALKKKDGKVTLVGFGTFQKTRKIKARNVVKFKAGKKLKESV